jgi:gas vesicle protein
VSDEGGGGSVGPFLLGVAVGAALGALFAPHAGEVTRKEVRRKLRGLRDLAEEKAGELTALVVSDDDGDADESEAPAEPRSARDELEQRLTEARRRRRNAKRARDPEEEDEPVA